MKETTRDDWDAYWQRHASTGYVNYTPQIVETIDNYIDLKGCQILEIGVGSGVNSAKLAALGAEVTTLDFSKVALKHAKLTANKMKVNLTEVQGDAWSLPFAIGTFDLVFHQGFLEHFCDPLPLLYEQKRVLREMGHILIDVPQRYNLYTLYKRYRISRGDWDCGGWETEFSHRQLGRLVTECGFRLVESYGRYVFPYLVSARNQLKRLENALFKAHGFPPAVWRLYDSFWHRLEHSSIGRNTLMCIGILAQKV